MRDELKFAVVGSGIAGLSCAWLLGQRHKVTLYEQAQRLGGHANTAMVEGARGHFAVDTGFIVYNERTYPNLTALFAHLRVPTQPSDMSFAASLDGGALEYAGTGLRGLFGQKRNLFRPRFWAMLADLRRLYAQAVHDPVMNEPDLTSLGQWLARHNYGPALLQDHVLPMAAAIWSGPASNMLDYPAAAFFRFCDNHGLLRLQDRPDWRTISGGSAVYVEKLASACLAEMRLGCPIAAVRRIENGVVLQENNGERRVFDHVVLATHAPQALALLQDADAQERALLGAFGTTRNIAVLHRDASFMPRRKAVWASWNYIGTRDGRQPPSVTYWMNNLQGLPGEKPIFVTLNPARALAQGSEITRQTYEHPLFNSAAMQAQRKLWNLQGPRRTWFCGAWFGAGFHEDGLQAGLAVAEALGGGRRPWRVKDESGRIYVGATHSAAVGALA